MSVHAILPSTDLSQAYLALAPVSVRCFQEVCNWFVQDDPVFNRSVLVKAEPRALTTLLGPPSGQFQGSTYVFDLWRQELTHARLWILSAPGFGCVYEVDFPNGKRSWALMLAERQQTVHAILTFFVTHGRELSAAVASPVNVAAKPRPRITLATSRTRK